MTPEEPEIFTVCYLAMLFRSKFEVSPGEQMPSASLPFLPWTQRLTSIRPDASN